MAVLPSAALKQAIAYEDLDALVRVPGIGRKGAAAKIVIELKDKVLALGVQPSARDVARRPEPGLQPGLAATRSGRRCSASATPPARPTRPSRPCPPTCPPAPPPVRAAPT